MTNISYKFSGDRMLIEINGHAGYAEKGQDIVCSAISCLIQTLIVHMDEVADTYNYDLTSGKGYVSAKGREAVMSAKTILTGFRMLAENYPDYVTISAL